MGAKLPPNQTLDGRSFLPVLRGEATTHRDTIFTFFPHNTAASGQLPACAVRRGDWKLIRYFHDGPKQEHRYELYNLRDDLSETNNLAAEQPARLKELDRLIEGFLKDTPAVVPGPNPVYGKAAGSAAAAPGDPLEGWKARGCTAMVSNGILTVKGASATPFLGFPAGKLDGLAKLSFRLRSHDGHGKVEWLPGVKAKPAETKSTPFSLKNSGWEELSVPLPHQPGQPGIMRLYLPAQDYPVEVDWIQLTFGDKTRRWEFNEK